MALTVDAVIALDGHRSQWFGPGRGEVGNHVKGTNHGAHAADDAPVAVDEDDIRIGIAADGCRGADRLARCGAAVAALAGKGRVQVYAGSGDDESARGGCFLERPVEGLTLGVLHEAGNFTLVTTDAPFRIDEHSLHVVLPFL